MIECGITDFIYLTIIKGFLILSFFLYLIFGVFFIFKNKEKDHGNDKME